MSDGSGVNVVRPHGDVAPGLTPRSHRGPAFGLLAGVQSLGNLVASGVAGVLWTAVSPAGGLPFADALVLVMFACLAWAARQRATL